jgi:hypothetical protein
MPDAVIDSAIRALKVRRDEIDSIIRNLQRVSGGSSSSTPVSGGRRPATKSATKKVRSRRGKPMSAAVKEKLRAAYAANHPGWKPKKK